MKPERKTRTFTDRDKMIYNAGLRGQKIELLNDTEQTIYDCGVNQSEIILKRLAEQDRIIKRQKDVISSQKRGYAAMCESMKRSNANLLEMLQEDDTKFPIDHVILSLSESRQIYKHLRTKSKKPEKPIDYDHFANLIQGRIEEVETEQAKTAEKILNHLENLEKE